MKHNTPQLSCGGKIVARFHAAFAGICALAALSGAPVPAAAQQADDVSLVAAGGYHSLFVTADGQLRSMGENWAGQLGTGTFANQSAPVTIATGVTAVAAREYHSLFITADAKLWAVGRNRDGQLGFAHTLDRSTPVNVADDVVAIAAGGMHNLFLTADGQVWGMGSSGAGQLGEGTLATSQSAQRNFPLPIAMQNAGNATAIAAGMSHSLFITADGDLWATGSNSAGQLGNPDVANASKSTSTPVFVAADVVAVAAGHDYSLFITGDGKLWATGSNSYGQLGSGAASNIPTMSPVVVAENVVAVAAGVAHSLFITSDG
jgi:alpha-tubulin suppressor-like RCC1 family protein